MLRRCSWTTNIRQHGEGLTEGMEGQGVTGLWKDEFEELDETFDTIVWFPELRTKSQYTQKIATITGAHNLRQWQPGCSVPLL